ncbi:hypothetical protein Tsp_03847 [Trichinella spiralis]|uniref:hypothetical protein n=1 Tax=Trichinella spiralis TaxID=6334 RepID=UPI0001EFC2DD|nr:hypothetical protein Tsp_03847 [Trichinella spiralis]
MVQQTEEPMDHFLHFCIRKNYYGEEAFYTKAPAVKMLLQNAILQTGFQRTNICKQSKIKCSTVVHCNNGAVGLKKMLNLQSCVVRRTVAVTLFLCQLLRVI